MRGSKFHIQTEQNAELYFLYILIFALFDRRQECKRVLVVKVLYYKSGGRWFDPS